MARPLTPPMTPAQKMMKKSPQSPPAQPQSGVGRFLITVNVVGSAGPIRFVVREQDLVGAVIGTALRSYAREGRLPVLGSDLNSFLLYCANTGTDALSPEEPIGIQGCRNFVLHKKQGATAEVTVRPAKKVGFKAWINKSLSLKIVSH